MANTEYVDIFKQGAQAIDRWRTENSDAILDLKLDLSGADLSGADLTETNLVGVDLSGANLVGADLSGADLVGANLAGANLEEADLCFADLSNADLSGANFHRANLRETVLNDAHSCNTLWVEIDLSRTVGLETVIHKGPSTIGVNTLMWSKGQIPKAFLLGCGLPDEVILYVTNYFANDANEFFSCFISFSSKDKVFAHRLHDQLQARGIRCWLDEKQTLPGIGKSRDRKLKIWDKVLLCTSQHSLTSDWVNQEIEDAFVNEDRQYKRDTDVICSLLPLNLDDHLLDTWKHKDKETISARVVADFQGWEEDLSKFETQVDRVITALNTKNTDLEPKQIEK